MIRLGVLGLLCVCFFCYVLSTVTAPVTYVFVSFVMYFLRQLFQFLAFVSFVMYFLLQLLQSLMFVSFVVYLPLQLLQSLMFVSFVMYFLLQLLQSFLQNRSQLQSSLFYEVLH